MKRLYIILFLLAVTLSMAFSQYYNSYTYVVGDFELCDKNFVEEMPINEMSEDSYRVYSNTFRKVPAGSYEFFVQYYSVYYGYESIDKEKSTSGFFMGNTSHSNKYTKSQAIAFTIDTVSDITIKFNRNTDKVILLSSSDLVKGNDFLYFEYNNSGSSEIKKVYTGIGYDFSTTLPLNKGNCSLKIAKDYNSPLPADTTCSNIITHGANPITFRLEENADLSIKLTDNKVCLTIPIIEPDTIGDNEYIDSYDPEFEQY